MRSFIVALSFVSVLGSRAFAQSEVSPAPPAVAPTIAAAPPPSQRGASVWGILPWGGIGAGARFMLPLRIPPLLSRTSVRDSFSLEFGADVLRWNYGEDTFYTSSYSWTEVLPVVGVSWNLWFSDSFALYPKVEAGYAFGWLSNTVAYGGPGYGGTFVNGAGGLLYKLGGGLTLRAEAGFSGLKLGAGWLF